jgi:uncharacterized protein with von Willebrand factor type A (vWA) domain
VTEPFAAQQAPSPGRLAENILAFARTLRAAGLPVGPGRVLEGVAAVEAVGIARRDDLYWALNAVFVNRRDQQELFDQAFHVFWRNPKLIDRMRALFLPSVSPIFENEADQQREINRRLSDILAGGEATAEKPSDEVEEKVELDAVLTFSDRELLQAKDFETMSAAEMADAKDALARLRLPIGLVRTRRFRTDRRGRQADPRRTLRAALRSGRDSIPLQWKTRRLRPPPLVVLCDISGSMGRYSRMLLHFLHALTNDRDRVSTFLFGTRLSNITRALRNRDVDLALDKVARSVPDWDGGTRIGHCLADFNRLWARRVLAQGAVVLLITDGLDREGAAGLRAEMERLHKSCRRLIWLNPLLRYDAYAPKSQGAQAILPQVDEFRPIHNLDSLRELAGALSRPAPPRLLAGRDWSEEGRR